MRGIAFLVRYVHGFELLSPNITFQSPLAFFISSITTPSSTIANKIKTTTTSLASPQWTQRNIEHCARHTLKAWCGILNTTTKDVPLGSGIIRTIMVPCSVISLISTASWKTFPLRTSSASLFVHTSNFWVVCRHLHPIYSQSRTNGL